MLKHFNCWTFVSISVSSSTRWSPPSLDRAGIKSSGPGRLRRFRNQRSLPNSAFLGEAVVTGHGDQYNMTDVAGEAAQLNRSLNNSPHHPRRWWMLLIGTLLPSQIVSLTPKFLLSVTRVSCRFFRR